MKEMKRFVSLLLCLAMMFSVLPVGAFAAGTTPLAAAIFGSDIHETNTSLTGSGTSAMKSILSAIGTNDVTYDTIGFVGDTYTDIAGTKAAMTSAAQTALGQNPEVFYAWGDHDSKSDISSESGLLYTGDYHYIYHISDADMRSKAGATSTDTASAISAFETAAASMDKSKVLFIMSHVPLHDRRDDNTYANDWYTAIKAVADTMEVVFFWAHNHTSESDVDRAAYYVERDGSEQITIYGGDTVTPNFTYMNAGYIYAAGQNPSRLGVVTTVEIYADSLVFQDYSSSGEYTDSTYSHNVTVKREFTDSVDSGDSGSTDTTDPTDPTEPSTDPSTEPSEEVTEPSTEGSSGQTSTLTGEESNATVPGYSNTVETEVWKLTDTVTAGTYLIVNTNTAGSGYALLNNNGTVSAVAVEVVNDGTNTYIELDNANAEWTFTASGSDWLVSNNGNYLVHPDNSLDLSTTGVTWASNGTNLYYSTTVLFWTVSYYLTGGSSWSVGTDAANVYFYTPTTITTGTTVPDTTYHMDLTVNGNAVSNHAYTVTGVENGTTAQMGAAFTATANDTTTSATAPSGGSYTVLSSSNEEVATIGTDGVLTFTGVEGETLIQVEYTWTEDGETYTTKNYVVITAKAPVYGLVASCDDTQIKIGEKTTVAASATKDGTAYSDATGITFASSDETIATVAADGTVTGVKAGDVNITATWTAPKGIIHTETVAIEVVDAVYALDICKKIENADGTTTFESITAPIVIKGVTNGMTHSVWAVITADGEDIGALDEEGLAKLSFTSSDESIATVDKTTGTVTFTGAEGTVNITASYEYADGKFVTDTVTFSVTASNYSIPSDGPSDFPEYPNEGAIRFDKTATAVGTFSQTGIAQVELSMTGVPYSTGSEIDVMVMLDMTGSMSDNGMEAAELATIAFVEKIVKNEDGTYNENRVAVYAFNSGSSSPYELVSLKKITSDDDLATATTAIKTASDKQASGGTPFDEAAKQCYDVLQAAKTDGTGNDRQQFCVFMSDGGPTTYYGSDQKTYYGGNNNSGDVLLTSCMSGYSSSDSSDWSFTLPTEYYTDALKADGVVVYTVGLLLQTAPSNPAPYSSMTDSTYDSTTDSLTTIGSHYYFCSSILKQMASDDSKYIDIFNVNNASNATAAFESIAKSILQAATDVTVEDKINDEYTMVFDIPTNVYDVHNAEVAEALDGQEFYIEFVEYALDADHERTTYTTLTKLYLKDSNGDTAGGTYSAASDASGTAYTAPVFENKTLGDKGTLYYWTTDSTKSTSGISYSDGTNTYYFVPYGIKATDDGYDSTKWFNMTSGGYASGNIDETTNMSADLVIATPYFVYNAATRMLYWTVEKLDTSEYALRYFLYLDNSSTDVGETTETDAGPYPTNDYAYITYTNFNKNDCRQEFPIPQMTWNGATVSYVFYLVNEAGQPINKSGQVVDFANATFITDVFEHTVVWNGDNAVEELNIEYLADELLPDAYIVYDEQAEYTIHVYQDETGKSVFDYFIIAGSAEGTVNAVNGNTVNSDDTTKVYNTKAGTKYSEYGTYSDQAVGTNFTTTDAEGNTVTITTTKHASLDYSDTTVAFAVLWTPRLVEDTVVVDYGLDVLINVVENDILQNVVSGIGLGNDTFISNNVTMNTGVYNQGAESGKLGTVPLTLGDGSTISLENDNAIRFHQNDMTFADPVTFYYESPVEFYEGSNKQTGYLYSSVTVIPATTIYYEDSFVDLTVWDSTTYEELKENWVTVGTASSTATQQQDRPGESQISAVLDADNVYGYDAAYSACSKYSLGSAQMITVDSKKFAEAQFTFYGTGFDVIALTSNTTGTIAVDVYNAADFEANSYDATIVKTDLVDTYYGYKQEAGDADGDGTVEDGELVWVVDPTATDSLYQVPVIKVEDLAYGKYTAVITTAYFSGFDHQKHGSLDFYLDAIRIYDPAGTEYGTNDGADGTTGNLIDSTIQNAYIDDKEGWPVYQELRNNVITAADAGQIAGAVFVDGSDEVYAVSDYTAYGPNNELYLAGGQMIMFSMNLSSDNVASLQIGMKSANGDAVTCAVFDTANVQDQGDIEGLATMTISTATDMYYDITDLKDATITIFNNSDSILSITDLKVTFATDPGDVTAALSTIAEEDLNTFVEALNTPETTEGTTEAPTEDEGGSAGNTVIDRIVSALKKLFGWG